LKPYLGVGVVAWVLRLLLVPTLAYRLMAGGAWVGRGGFSCVSTKKRPGLARALFLFLIRWSGFAYFFAWASHLVASSTQ
ncbi:hypothetical protein, partial [Comamonas sp. MYb69]|uniref:hypothetical protein n=1 Tax=Comamonas sp. MYb69 TaxID=1848650 RepID=UPI0030B08EF3